ncbi:MAG: DUF1800 domain-containing protein [Rhodocyclales bacterium]|jgi:uncharacterized protein (DUF1800 family)|nr:DUF1800 domain-containing protein [Rhodocyclales bacterium]
MHGVLRILASMCAACALSASAAPMGSDDARHLLNRAGFGARPGDLAGFAQLSREAAVEQLLVDTSGVALPAVPAELADYMSPSRLRALSDEERKEHQKSSAIALRAWWVGTLLGASTPAAQLRERMTLFWHNHFVSSLQKVKSAKLMADQNRLLRRHALGRFDELLHAVGKDPAMVVYLDSATNRRGSPNENFAREVMELFTLGEGNFSEQDVKEAARAFTGWSIEPATGEFRWRPFAHDGERKTVLGVSGSFDGDAVLDILLAQPQTAELLVRKLWREFISWTPDEREVRRIAVRLRGSGYDMRVALREVFGSRAFWAAENRLALIKSPVDWVIGTLNTLDIEAPDAAALAFALRQIGQDLFAPPNVKGWPGGEAWINSSTLLARKQMAERLLRRDGRMGMREALLDPAYQLK